jgi:hypothetical protein
VLPSGNDDVHYLYFDASRTPVRSGNKSPPPLPPGYIAHASDPYMVGTSRLYVQSTDISSTELVQKLDWSQERSDNSTMQA